LNSIVSFRDNGFVVAVNGNGPEIKSWIFLCNLGKRFVQYLGFFIKPDQKEGKPAF
jgi:hypothetical protein